MADPSALIQGASALFGGTSGAPSSASSTSVGRSEGQTGSKTFSFSPPVYQSGSVTGRSVNVDWLVLGALAVAAIWVSKKAK